LVKKTKPRWSKALQKNNSRRGLSIRRCGREADGVRIRQFGINSRRKPGAELLDGIMVQIRPGQTLRFVLTPQTSQVNRIHHGGTYPTRLSVSKIHRGRIKSGGFRLCGLPRFVNNRKCLV
jgi:hypothetical protein